MPVLQKKALFSAFIICQVLRIIQNYMEVSPAKSLILSATIHGGSYFFIQPVTGDVEARICAIACSTPPEGTSRWTMQAIADELIRLEVVDYITDSTVCNVMKKTKLNRGL